MAPFPGAAATGADAPVRTGPRAPVRRGPDAPVPGPPTPVPDRAARPRTDR
ncbi:hypothetical protein ACIQVN_33510 [Streptomyces cyaneofuscatus]|uniref:hypothetical protein n=1 Tax=Streptomyces cyaneofuscatus TaxID=66883 RepID=UPI003825CD93